MFCVLNIWIYISMAGIVSLILNYNHLLNSLLSLEFISLGLFMGLFLSFLYLGVENYFSLYLLVLMVSEGVLGLVLLVVVIFSYSSDYLKSLDVLMC
uniref:NADH-ubiquinone oxidoreductase chain 4L n=1 Tax=Halice sp. JL-2018 TaxID=2528348 RepID=A0A3S8IF74_9CRUS|nr:NADH dehydrogenase subunit 4L [Halice sp. JL-2018]